MLLTLPIREVLAATPRAHIVRLDLGDRDFPFAPGQAVMAGRQGTARSPYSIACAPEDAARERVLELLVGIDPQDAAGARFEPGMHDRAEVEGPFGTFTFPAAPNERRFLFVAGGTGIAPLRSMWRHALTIPHESIGLFYSARTPDEFAYAREVSALADAGDIELRQTVTRWPAAEWPGGRGRLTRDALAALVHDAATLCFVCGPPALVDEVPRLLVDLGIARRRIRVEGDEPESLG